MGKSIQAKQCAYCGVDNVALTRDHFVPQCLWPRGELPRQVVTVPACETCNARYGKHADYFRTIVLSMMGTAEHPLAKQLVDGPVKRSLARSPKVREAIFGRIRLEKIRGKLQPQYQLKTKRFQVTIEQIIKGLYFLREGTPVPKDMVVSFFPVNAFRVPALYEIVKQMGRPRGFGDDGVFYEQHERYSNGVAFHLMFYRSVSFFAALWPKKIAKVRPPQSKRNRACGCGSGKKFKRCCWKRKGRFKHRDGR